MNAAPKFRERVVGCGDRYLVFHKRFDGLVLLLSSEFDPMVADQPNGVLGVEEFVPIFPSCRI